MARCKIEPQSCRGRRYVPSKVFFSRRGESPRWRPAARVIFVIRRGQIIRGGDVQEVMEILFGIDAWKEIEVNGIFAIGPNNEFITLVQWNLRNVILDKVRTFLFQFLAVGQCSDRNWRFAKKRSEGSGFDGNMPISA